MPAVRGETVVVPHPPDADIEAIRDILQGYNEPASILKELIQNAEDAGATRMEPKLPEKVSRQKEALR
jgi:hypothetical protein